MADSELRRITAEEYQFALSIFQREFPPRDEITISRGTGTLGSSYVRPTITGHIRIYLGAQADYTLLTPETRGVFAHELTHAWQLRHFGKAWYMAHATWDDWLHPITNHLGYKCNAKKKLGDYGMEQQAEIVRNYVLGHECEAKIVERALFSDTWKLMIGSDASDVAIDGDGSLYMTNSSGLIYSYGRIDWKKLSGSDALAIAANAGTVVISNTAGKIYQRQGSSWRQLPGSDALDVAIADDGTIFMVNSVGKIYRYDATKGWSQLPGSDGARIAAGGGQLWLVNTVGKIYRYASRKWAQVTGSAGRDITVSSEGRVFLTNTVGKIYERRGDAWKQLDGSDGLTVSANNGKLVMVNTAGRLFVREY